MAALAPGFALLLVALLLPLTARAESADAIIQRHLQAMGGVVALKAIDNLVYRGGTYREADYSSDGKATMSMARPYFKLVGDKRQPGGFMEGYDGSSWEWFADPGVVLRTVGKASEASRHYAGVDGPFVDYKARGSSAQYLGEDRLDDRSVDLVALTRRDGFTEVFYFDRKSGLVVARRMQAPVHAIGQSVDRLTRIGDYRDVSGVLIPHRFTTVMLPGLAELDSMQWGEVVANVDLPEDWFSPPEFRRTAIQNLIEQLYGQRDDLQAMLWTYHEYRLAHPDLDIASAVSFVGYQILKMGQVAHAIGLLEQSLSDHPDHAETQAFLDHARRADPNNEPLRP